MPLQPIAISSFHKNLNFWRRSAGKVIIDLLEPLPTAGLTKAQIPELMATAHARMKAAIDALDAELTAGTS